MATNEELRDAKNETRELREQVTALQLELTQLKKNNETSTTELNAATQALSAIRILTREENGIAEAVHTLACNWKNFQ